MSSGKKTAPTVSVLAEHVSDHLSVFVVAEDTDAKRPAMTWRPCPPQKEPDHLPQRI